MNREINRVSDRGACRKKNGKVISGKINSIVSGNWEQREANFKNVYVCRRYGKRANLKTEVTRIQSTPDFPKNERF